MKNKAEGEEASSSTISQDFLGLPQPQENAMFCVQPHNTIPLICQ